MAATFFILVFHNSVPKLNFWRIQKRALSAKCRFCLAWLITDSHITQRKPVCSSTSTSSSTISASFFFFFYQKRQFYHVTQDIAQIFDERIIEPVWRAANLKNRALALQTIFFNEICAACFLMFAWHSVQLCISFSCSIPWYHARTRNPVYAHAVVILRSLKNWDAVCIEQGGGS